MKRSFALAAALLLGLSGCGAPAALTSTVVPTQASASWSAANQAEAKRLAKKALEAIDKAESTDAKIDAANRQIREVSRHFFFRRGWGYTVIDLTRDLGYEDVNRKDLLAWDVKMLRRIEKTGDWDEADTGVLERADELMKAFSVKADRHEVMGRVMGRFSVDFETARPTKSRGFDTIVDEVEQVALPAAGAIRRAKTYEAALELYEDAIRQIRAILKKG